MKNILVSFLIWFLLSRTCQAQEGTTYSEASVVATPSSILKPDLVVTHVSVQHAPDRGQVQFVVQDRFQLPFESFPGMNIPFQWQLTHWNNPGTLLDSGEARLRPTENLPARLEPKPVINNAVTIVTDFDVGRVFQGQTAQLLRFTINPSRTFEEAHYTNNELIANLGVPCDLPEGCSTVTAATQLEGVWVSGDSPGVLWLDIRYTFDEALAGTDPYFEVGPRVPYMFSFRLTNGFPAINEVQCVTGRAGRGVPVGRSRIARYLCSFSKLRARARPEVSEWITEDVQVVLDTRLTGTRSPIHRLTLPYRKSWMNGLEEDYGRASLPDLRPIGLELPNLRSWSGNRVVRIVVVNQGNVLSRESKLLIQMDTDEGQSFKELVPTPRILPGDTAVLTVSVPGTGPDGTTRRWRCDPYTARVEADVAGDVLESHEAPWEEAPNNNLATARMDICSG